MAVRFVSAPIVPGATFVETGATSRGEPLLPQRFRWNGSDLAIASVVRTWRSTKTDRGDAYLARHWFEIRTHDGRTAVIYFDRTATRARPHWWLYTIDDGRRTDEP